MDGATVATGTKNAEMYLGLLHSVENLRVYGPARRTPCLGSTYERLRGQSAMQHPTIIQLAHFFFTASRCMRQHQLPLQQAVKGRGRDMSNDTAAISHTEAP